VAWQAGPARVTRVRLQCRDRSHPTRCARSDHRSVAFGRSGNGHLDHLSVVVEQTVLLAVADRTVWPERAWSPPGAAWQRRRTHYTRTCIRVFDPPDAESVGAQYDRIIDAPAENCPEWRTIWTRPARIGWRSPLSQADLAPDLVQQPPVSGARHAYVGRRRKTEQGPRRRQRGASRVNLSAATTGRVPPLLRWPSRPGEREQVKFNSAWLLLFVWVRVCTR
jgi:hypothetical protein